ncbi:hypothetical protein BDD12DRAFT_883969 [Trichophaea hybrida]|nr:hypothetical protein BDD12DRAFT_883969 [Trichophaea hybrida]
MTNPVPPQNCIVLCKASFDSSTSALEICKEAWIVPREEIATLDGLKSTIRSHLKLALIHNLIIYMSLVVFKLERPVLAGVAMMDWERLCALEAWDFIYVEGSGDALAKQEDMGTVRVSKGRWSIGE